MLHYLQCLVHARLSASVSRRHSLLLVRQIDGILYLNLAVMESPLPTSPSQSGDSFTSRSSFPSPASYSSAADSRSSDVAIIGFSLELPGASSTEAFWDLMMEGRCVASKFPPSRINGARYRGVGGSVSPRVTHFCASKHLFPSPNFSL